MARKPTRREQQVTHEIEGLIGDLDDLDPGDELDEDGLADAFDLDGTVPYRLAEGSPDEDDGDPVWPLGEPWLDDPMASAVWWSLYMQLKTRRRLH